MVEHKRYRITDRVERTAIARAEGRVTGEEIATLESLEPDELTTVYYFHNADHQLLYVGISGQAMRRFGQHLHDKTWWTEVAYASMEHFDTRRQALNREAHAIRTLEPRHNKTRPGAAPATNEFGVRFCAAGCGGAAPDGGATCGRCRTRAYRERQAG